MGARPCGGYGSSRDGHKRHKGVEVADPLCVASIDAQWLLVRVPELLEPFVAIGSGLMMLEPNVGRPK